MLAGVLIATLFHLGIGIHVGYFAIEVIRFVGRVAISDARRGECSYKSTPIERRFRPCLSRLQRPRRLIEHRL